MHPWVERQDLREVELADEGGADHRDGQLGGVRAEPGQAAPADPPGDLPAGRPIAASSCWIGNTGAPSRSW
nr:hypothetical protein [Kitasatospora fiedleri]